MAFELDGIPAGNGRPGTGSGDTEYMNTALKRPLAESFPDVEGGPCDGSESLTDFVAPEESKGV